MGKRKDKVKSSSSRGSSGSKNAKASKYSYSEMFPVNIAVPISNSPPPKPSCCHRIFEPAHHLVENKLIDPIKKKPQRVITVGKLCICGLLFTILINFYFGSFPSKNQINSSGIITSTPPLNQNGTPLSRQDIIVSDILKTNFGVIPSPLISDSIYSLAIGVIEHSIPMPILCSKDNDYSKVLISYNMNEIENKLLDISTLWSQGKIWSPNSIHSFNNNGIETIIQDDCLNLETMALQDVMQGLENVFEVSFIKEWMQESSQLLNDLSTSFRYSQHRFNNRQDKEEEENEEENSSKITQYLEEIVNKIFSCDQLETFLITNNRKTMLFTSNQQENNNIKNINAKNNDASFTKIIANSVLKLEREMMETSSSSLDSSSDLHVSSSYETTALNLCKDIRNEMKLLLAANLSENDRIKLYPMPINSILPCNLALKYSDSLNLNIILSEIQSQNDLCIIKEFILESSNENNENNDNNDNEKEEEEGEEEEKGEMEDDSIWLYVKNDEVSNSFDSFLNPCWYQSTPTLLQLSSDQLQLPTSTSSEETTSLRGTLNNKILDVNNHLNNKKSDIVIVIPYDESDVDILIESFTSLLPTSTSTSTSTSSSSQLLTCSIPLVFVCSHQPSKEKMKLLVSSLHEVFNKNCFLSMDNNDNNDNNNKDNANKEDYKESSMISFLSMDISSSSSNDLFTSEDHGAASWWALFNLLSPYYNSFTMLDIVRESVKRKMDGKDNNKEDKAVNKNIQSFYHDLITMDKSFYSEGVCSSWWIRSKTICSSSFSSFSSSTTNLIGNKIATETKLTDGRRSWDDLNFIYGEIYSLGCKEFDEYIHLLRSFYPPRWRNGGECIQVKGCEVIISETRNQESEKEQEEESDQESEQNHEKEKEKGEKGLIRRGALSLFNSYLFDVSLMEGVDMGKDWSRYFEKDDISSCL